MDTEAAARTLAADRLAHRPFGGFGAGADGLDEATAYAIQARLHRHLVGRDGVQVGWKIGCTTPVMQEFLAIDRPCAGRIRAGGLYQGSADLAVADYARVGVECEIAVRLGRDLPASGRPWTRAAVGAAIGACMAAIEIVDERYVDYRTLGAPSLIADDFFHAGCILGRPVATVAPDALAALTGRMVIDGVEVGSGRGAEILGEPLAALEWLANGAATAETGLAAGEIVMLGSLVRTHWPGPGSTVEIEIAQLGSVSARFH
ncbi:MAG: fumarylacetoacetate hydrolase family protein [Alphaproteobacteria bacterium]